MKREHAFKLRELLYKISKAMTDVDALEAIEFFPLWKVDTAYTTNERIRYEGKLYKVLLDHTSQADWTPDIAVSLYVEVSVEEIPVWKQPIGSQDAYNKGDKVHYPTKEDSIYESDIDANVYAPDVYGWHIVQ